MTLDLIGVGEDMFQNTWFAMLVTLAILSCAWYYIRHVAKGTGSGRNLLVGQPLQLILILAVLFAVVALAVYVFDVGLA
jgi:hypothetical protein